MSLRQQLPVTYLLFSRRGRIDRLTYWNLQLFIWLTFYIAFNVIDYVISYSATIIIYPILFYALICTSTKRLHDTSLSGYFLFTMLVPVLGPLWMFYRLGLKPGKSEANRYGSAPGSKEDYFVNESGGPIEHLTTEDQIVNDVTNLNPVIVAKVCRPTSISEIQALVKNSDGKICIGGGRFSMGGQTASHQALHIDLRDFNNVVEYEKNEKKIKVQTGIRWCDIQKLIDKDDLSLSIMQTYANFTVGGSLSVNSHGRYIGQGPLILSVLSIEVVLADGSLAYASPTENAELFFACIGGYNAVGIIVNAELKLSDNIRVKRVNKKMDRDAYRVYFTENIRGNRQAIFHNGDIYPPHYMKVNAVTWEETSDKPTVKTRLMPLGRL